MDGRQFDQIVKQFCTTPLTRWSALRGLMAGLVAALTGLSIFEGDGEAKNKKHSKQKGHGGPHGQSKKKNHGPAHAKGKQKGHGGPHGQSKKKGGKRKASTKQKPPPP